jgi:NAD(P)H-dependent FMN reductase
MSEVLVISCSLNPESRSRLLSRAAFERLSQKVPAKWLDLRDYSLPICDGDAAYENPRVPEVSEKIAQAGCVLLGIPVYNFAASASAKNLIELTGRAWEQKVVGFLCAAGGRSSYMSVMGLANSLMLDFRCLIIPRFVYAAGQAFQDDKIVDPEIIQRIDELVDTALHLTRAVESGR